MIADQFQHSLLYLRMYRQGYYQLLITLKHNFGNEFIFRYCISHSLFCNPIELLLLNILANYCDYIFT